MVATITRSISIFEYQKVFMNQTIDGVTITKKDIDELKAYIDDTNIKKLTNSEALYNFLIPIRNGVQATNFVGVIQTKSGLTIEILPKIFKHNDEANDREKIRELFFKMLKTVKSVNGKVFKLTKLNAKRNQLLEVFIAMFLSESDAIIKSGLKSTYVSIISNEKYLKGKLLISQQIRKNSMNQSHFYNEFDEFLIDSPENQLIRTTLQLLLSISKDNNNLRIIREQLIHFDSVSLTNNSEQTFQKINLGRNYKNYSQVLEWCRLFLKGSSFTSFKGQSTALAILFPMEKIFEAYISYLVAFYLTDEKVSTQDSRYSLFDKTNETREAYKLRPDIVVRKKNQSVVIADTKWKLLDSFGPKQSDLYQMYAYYTRYHHNLELVEKVVLIYPLSEFYQEKEFRSVAMEADQLASKIQVKFIDLFSNDMKEQIMNVFE